MTSNSPALNSTKASAVGIGIFGTGKPSGSGRKPLNDTWVPRKDKAFGWMRLQKKGVVVGKSKLKRNCVVNGAVGGI